MGKNKGLGGKNRRRGTRDPGFSRDIIFKEEGQEYAQVIRMLGGSRLEAQCFDGTRRLCHIRGKMNKKEWVSAGDIVLIGLRDYQDTKADIIHRYNAEETRNLRAYNEIPPENTNFQSSDDCKLNENVEQECTFDFDEI